MKRQALRRKVPFIDAVQPDAFLRIGRAPMRASYPAALGIAIYRKSKCFVRMTFQ